MDNVTKWVLEMESKILMLRSENERLREALTLIVCESINAEYIAQKALDFDAPNVKVRGGTLL